MWTYLLILTAFFLVAAGSILMLMYRQRREFLELRDLAKVVITMKNEVSGLRQWRADHEEEATNVIQETSEKLNEILEFCNKAKKQFGLE